MRKFTTIIYADQGSGVVPTFHDTKSLLDVKWRVRKGQEKPLIQFFSIMALHCVIQWNNGINHWFFEFFHHKKKICGGQN